MAGANCGPVADGCGGLLSCGTCAPGQTCGAMTPSVCGTPGGGTTTCTNLCLRRATCTGTATTTISGTVVTPALTAPDPLYNAVVYIPNAPVAAFTPGVSCDRCGSPTSGSPVVSAVTGPDGRFVLRDVPVGANIPLVIQLGRWRRQVTITNVAPCVDNPLSTALTRLPRNRTEGDIPLMAMVTGNVDALECVLRKIGVSDSEFTIPSAGGRVQFYVANGATMGRTTPAATALYNDPAALARYDMVLFACEGSEINKPAAAQRNVINYANAGGRVFATHYSYTWLYNIAPWSSIATWRVGQARPGNPLTGIIDTSFPRGAAFAQWLRLVGASTGTNQISIVDPRHDVDAVVAPTARWIYSTTPSTVQHLTFNTPVGAAADAQCGRVLFSDFHVSGATTGGRTFPTECSNTPLTAQEKVLEFMLFDLASCVAPDMPRPPTCTPRTCAAAGATCGPIGDGCGGMLNCGTCAAPLTCGGGGVPSACGTTTCRPRTCVEQGLSCGPAGDGCGGTLNCGTCPAGMTCGGGGTIGVCGAPACRPQTCASQMLTCGPAGDGCGNTLDCGACPAGTTCGGGGTPGTCGSPMCRADLRRPGDHVRPRGQRLRRHHRLRHLPCGLDLRRRRNTRRLRLADVSPADLRGAGPLVRSRGRRLRRDARLRHLRGASLLRRRRNARRLRHLDVSSSHLRRAEPPLRPRGRRLRRPPRLRHLRDGHLLRRRRDARRLRHALVSRANLRGAGPLVRPRRRRLRQPHPVRQLHCAAHLRRRWDARRLWPRPLHASHVRRRQRRVRRARRRLRRHPRLRSVPDGPRVRRLGHRQPLRRSRLIRRRLRPA